jgi:signal recognition particle receptor subunit beta
MVLFNYATRELTAKIVYYGPGLCGKTTNLQFIHQNLPETVKGKMLSLATKTDRTLFFDFLPLDLGEIRGMKTRVQLYTVPGQVFYNETRKLVLKGVDGVVFVADSQKDMIGPNVESFKNLEENLRGHGLQLAELPHVVQFNKRDLPKLASIEEINASVNKYNAPFYESVATTGIGVRDTLNAITKLVLLHLTRKYGSASPEAQPAAVSKPIPVQPEVTPPSVVPTAIEAPAAVATPVAAVSTPSVEVPSPVAAAVTVGPSDELPDTQPAQTFADDEIDDLVDEVQAADAGLDDVVVDEPVVEDPVVAEAAPPDFEPIEIEPTALVEEPLEVEQEVEVEVEVDRQTVDAEESVVVEDPDVGEQTAEVTLTEVASDDDLFNDPNLEIAQLSAGQTREIVIPVEVAAADSAVRRFKLALKLRLDSVD